MRTFVESGTCFMQTMACIGRFLFTGLNYTENPSGAQAAKGRDFC